MLVQLCLNPAEPISCRSYKVSIKSVTVFDMLFVFFCRYILFLHAFPEQNSYWICIWTCIMHRSLAIFMWKCYQISNTTKKQRPLHIRIGDTIMDIKLNVMYKNRSLPISFLLKQVPKKTFARPSSASLVQNKRQLSHSSMTIPYHHWPYKLCIWKLGHCHRHSDMGERRYEFVQEISDHHTWWFGARTLK